MVLSLGLCLNSTSFLRPSLSFSFLFSLRLPRAKPCDDVVVGDDDDDDDDDDNTLVLVEHLQQVK